MSDLSLIPLQDWFETQLSQDWDGATGTVYVLATPSYTPTTTNTYIVVNPWKTNMQIAEITDYDSTAKTLTVSSISFEKGLGISSTAQSHSTGSKVIISDNYQFWEDIQTAVNSKLDKNGGNSTIYATTAARDSALGGDGAATLPYTNIYVTATGLFYNYNLSDAAWQSVDTGTSPWNATEASAGLVRTDVAPAGIPVALIQDNPKYDALAGTSGTPSSTNKYVTNDDTATAATADKVARRLAGGNITVVTETQGNNSTNAASTAYVDATITTYKNWTTTKNAADASTTQTIAHGLGKTPKFVRIRAFCEWASGAGDSIPAISESVYNWTTQSSVSFYTTGASFASWAGTVDTTFTLNTNWNSGTQTWVITVDGTNISIAWTKTNSPTGTYTILWEAQG